MILRSFLKKNSEDLFYNNNLISDFDDEFKYYIECSRTFAKFVFEIDTYPERTEEAKKLFEKIILSPFINKQKLINSLKRSFKKLYANGYKEYFDNEKIENDIDYYINSITSISFKILQTNTQNKNTPKNKKHLIFSAFVICIILLYYWGFNYLLDNHIMMQFTDYDDIQKYLNFEYKDIFYAFMFIYGFLFPPISFMYKNLAIRLPAPYTIGFLISTFLWILNFFNIAFYNTQLKLGMKMFCIFMAPSIISASIVILCFIVGTIHAIIIKDT